MVAAPPENEKKRKRQWALRSTVGRLSLLMLVGACAHAGEDGGAIASSDSGTSLLTDANPGGRRSAPVVDMDSASQGGTSSGVQDSSLAPADVGLQGDAAREEAASDGSTSGANGTSVDGATVTEGAAPAVEVMADRDSSPIVDEPDALVVVGDEEPSLTCAQACTTGCCDPSGTCLEGVTDEACGGGGAACEDCSPAGHTCQSNTCQAAAPPPPVQPAPEAGGPTCDVSSCLNLCVPCFVKCCKSDDTCGCALLFPRGPCN
jgi:hypothetical protein